MRTKVTYFIVNIVNSIASKLLKLESSPVGKECVLKSGMETKTDIITKEETILKFFLRKAPLLVYI